MKNIRRNGKTVQYLGDIHSTPELMVQLDKALALGAACKFRTSDNTHYRYDPGSRHCPRQLVQTETPADTVIHPDGTRVTTGGREGVATGLYCLNMGGVYAQVIVDGESHWNHAHLVTPIPFEEDPGDPDEAAYDDMLWAARERADDLGY